MDRAPKEWWQRIFDASYLRIYSFMEQHTERDLVFLKDVLDLRPGMRLLDMCCGYGRHSLALAGMGLRVSGVDYSASQLREARRRASTHGVTVEWVRADAREFTTRKRFDRAIIMFTSFGLLETEADDARVLGRMAQALKSGGALCLDTLNRDFIVRHYQPTVAFPIEGGHVIDSHRLDDLTGRLEASRVVYGLGRPLRYRFSIRLYTPRELILMAQAAGLDAREVYGSFDKKPPGPDASRLIVIARKP